MNARVFSARKIAFWSVLCTALLVFPSASPAFAVGHAGGFHGGGYGFGFRGGRGAFIYPNYGWDFGWWGDPFWYGYWPYYDDSMGTVKLENALKSDEVYINGAYIGTAKEEKSFHLNPGAYRIAVKNNGKDVLNQYVFIAGGKTMKLEVNDRH